MLSVIKPKILSTLYIFCPVPDLYIISLHVFRRFQFFQSFPKFSSNYYRLLLIKPGRDRAVQCHSLRNVSADPDLQQDPAFPFCCCLPKLSLQQLFANLSKEPDKFPTDKFLLGEKCSIYICLRPKFAEKKSGNKFTEEIFLKRQALSPDRNLF